MKKLVQSWNPRYVLYARAHGHAPEGMRAHDVVEWPGGNACGFMLWMSERWHEFAAHLGVNRYWASCYQKEFDVWLAVRVEALIDAQAVVAS